MYVSVAVSVCEMKTPAVSPTEENAVYALVSLMFLLTIGVVVLLAGSPGKSLCLP